MNRLIDEVVGGLVVQGKQWTGVGEGQCDEPSPPERTAHGAEREEPDNLALRSCACQRRHVIPIEGGKEVEPLATIIERLVQLLFDNRVPRATWQENICHTTSLCP
jgi:hypothetical protein